MHRRKALVSTLVCLAAAAVSPWLRSADTPGPAGERALEWTKRLVDLGPRPSGSQAHQRQQALITGALRQLKCELVEEQFTAQTPNGPIRMQNIIAKFPGDSGRVVVISGHYDTYHRPGLAFVGANDGGSSAGLLLALAEQLSGERQRDDVWLVFFDGEESIRAWAGDDHTYGSRHQAEVWRSDGTLSRVKALINVDMIGDADLGVVYEGYSTPWLRDLVWETARGLGYIDVFGPKTPAYVEDDHRPFLEAGVPAVDLIDFNYGPGNRYWHTEQDTPDKLSSRSFAVVLHVLDDLLARLAER